MYAYTNSTWPHGATLRGFDWSQLLGITIQHEKLELEVRKTELLKQEEDLKIQLAVLEESLLEVIVFF